MKRILFLTLVVLVARPAHAQNLALLQHGDSLRIKLQQNSTIRGSFAGSRQDTLFVISNGVERGLPLSRQVTIDRLVGYSRHPEKGLLWGVVLGAATGFLTYELSKTPKRECHTISWMFDSEVQCSDKRVDPNLSLSWVVAGGTFVVSTLLGSRRTPTWRRVHFADPQISADLRHTHRR